MKGYKRPRKEFEQFKKRHLMIMNEKYARTFNEITNLQNAALMFPLIKSKDPNSELHSIRTKNDYDPLIDYKEFNK